MAERAKSSPQTLTIEIQVAGFRKRMLFNRFAIVPEGDFRIIHFGFIRPPLVLDSFACALHQDTVERYRKENLDYLGKLGSLVPPAPGVWEPPFGHGTAIEPANIISLARHGAEAEIILHNVSLRGLIEFSKPSKIALPIPADPVALLRSDLEVHKHFIRQLHPIQ